MKKKNQKTITEEMVKNAVKAKVERMQEELRRNPNNRVVAKRLAEFKKIHKAKL